MRPPPKRRGRREALVALRLDPPAGARHRDGNQHAVLDPHHGPPARGHRPHNGVARQADALARRDGGARRRGDPAVPLLHHGRRQPGQQSG